MSQPVASTQRCGRIGNGCIRKLNLYAYTLSYKA